jgi:hypothetical protein
MPVWPCPECGAKKGDPHKPSCRRARVGRSTRLGRPSQRKAGKLSTHNRRDCTPVVYRTRGDTEYLRCSVCERSMGNRKKRN